MSNIQYICVISIHILDNIQVRSIEEAGPSICLAAGIILTFTYKKIDVLGN